MKLSEHVAKDSEESHPMFKCTSDMQNVVISMGSWGHRGPAPLYSYPETDLPSGRGFSCGDKWPV